MTKRYLVDTNILSQIIKPRANSSYIKRLEELMHQDSELVLSPVVYYELKRGLSKRQAEKQLQIFELLAELMSFIEIDKDTWDAASELWVSSQESGNPGLSDADILISAQALVLDAVVLTNDKGIHRLIPAQCEGW